jgi:hypothetical protein
MFQERQQGDRWKSLGCGAREQREECTRRRAGEALPGGIIDRNIPARQLGRDPARELAIRCDERSRAAGTLERFAQRDRDCKRFFARVVRFHDGESAQRARERTVGIFDEVAPAVGRGRRAQGFGEKFDARGSAVIVGGNRRPSRHLVACDADAG